MIVMRHLPPLCAYLDWENFEKNIMALKYETQPLTTIIMRAMEKK